MNGASAALRHTATVFCPREIQRIANHPKQRRGRRILHTDRLAINSERNQGRLLVCAWSKCEGLLSENEASRSARKKIKKKRWKARWTGQRNYPTRKNSLQLANASNPSCAAGRYLLPSGRRYRCGSTYSESEHS